MAKMTVQTPATPDFAKVTANMVSNWSQMNSRLISFAQNSVQANLAAAEQIRGAKNPQEVVDCQIRLAQKAYEECIDEAREMSALLARMSSETLAALNPR